MKILSITAELPPFNYGGYEVGVWRVTNALRDVCNAEVFFLTSMRGVTSGKHLGEKNCYRLLPRPGYKIVGEDYVAHHDRQLTNKQRSLALKMMEEVIESTEPDVVIFWQVFFYWDTVGGSMYDLKILNYLKKRDTPAYLFVSGPDLYVPQVISPRYMLTTKQYKRFYKFMRYHAGLARHGKSLEIVPLDWSKVAFCSEWLKQECIRLGCPADEGKVLHWGIDQGQTQPVTSFADVSNPVKFLWAGRICREKGLHVVIDAFKRLGRQEYTLDIYGYEEDQSYAKRIWEEIDAAGLNGSVNYRGFIQVNELREKMGSYDVFLFSSVYGEPFSIALLEAAASGLALVSTLTGGTPEILSNNNSLTYDAEDSEQLAEGIQQLLNNPSEILRFRKLAKQAVESFKLEDMARSLYSWVS